MATTKGVVSKLITREWKDKTFYSVGLEGEKGFISLGTSRGGIAEGDYVEIEWEENAKGYKDAVKGGVKKLEKPKNQPAAAKAGGGGQPKDEGSIQYQSSRKDAIAYVQTVIAAGAVKLPAKEADKLAALDALVDLYTAKFYADIASKGAVARANGEDAPPAEDDGPPPVEDDEE